MLKNLVRTNRSYRRFDHSAAVSMQTLEDLVELARLCPSAANKQPLRFILCSSPQENERIFPCLKWAAYLTDWKGPAANERPSAYIVVVNAVENWDMAQIDAGIMAQTMLLGAVEKGLGGCIIASVDRKKLGEIFALQEGIEIMLVLALGKPVEDVRIVDLPADGSIKYYRDEAQVHYVPKRGMAELILEKRA